VLRHAGRNFFESPMFHQIHDLIRHHGDLFYLITFAWTALEGETFVIFAGLAAQHKVVNVGLLFVASWLGSFCGDQVMFTVGRLFGTRILDHLPKWKPGAERALGWVERHAIGFILSYRFMYGVRNVSGIAIGLSHLSWKKFAAWNAVAAFVWAFVFVGFGYGFGDVIAHLHHREEVVQSGVREAMLAALGLFAFILLMRFAVTRMHRAGKRK